MKIKILLNFILINLIKTLKWSPESLAQTVTSWNYLNDKKI